MAVISCLQVSPCQLVSCSTFIYCIMIGTGSCPVNCMLCLVCVRCTMRLCMDPRYAKTCRSELGVKYIIIALCICWYCKDL